MAKRKILVSKDKNGDNSENTLMERLVSEAKKVAEAEIAEDRARLEAEMSERRRQLSEETKRIDEAKTQANREAKKIIEDANKESEKILFIARYNSDRIVLIANDKANQIVQEGRAQADQIEKELDERKRKIIKDLQDKADSVNVQVTALNERTTVLNEKITDLKLIQSENIAVHEKNRMLERLLEGYKLALEKALGRTVSLDEIEEILAEKEKMEEKSEKCQDIINNPEFIKKVGKVQPLNIANNGRSIFEYTENGKWNKIGQVIMEKTDLPHKFQFGDRKIFELVSKSMESKSSRWQVCKDGLVIVQSPHNNIIGARAIVKSGDSYYNVINLFSSSKVIPMHDFLGLSNFLLLLDSAKINPQKNANGFSLNCLVYSQRKHKDSDECKFENKGNGLYHITLKMNGYPDFHKLGYDIYKALNCSSKGISQDVLDDENNHAFILSSQFEKNGDKLNWQKEIDLYRMPEDMSQSDGRE